MSRTLGSFNRRVNLPQHREDFQPSRLPRVAALRPERIPEERGGTSGGEKFAMGRGRSGEHRENRRYAGDVMNIDLRVGMSQPWDNIGSLTYGAPGTVGQMYTLPTGEIKEKVNEDISKRVFTQTETGQDTRILYGMQAAFAPPLGGAAESRTTAQYAQLPDAYYYT